MKNNCLTKADWEDYEKNLDSKYAYLAFAEKSLEDINLRFRQNIIEACDEIYWMPEKPFQYYVLRLQEFMDKKDFGEFGNSDSASCFINLILRKLETKPEDVSPVIFKLLPTIKYIAENQSEYEADIDIYGDFKEVYQKILDRL